jgi:hypothetical protein
MVSERVGSRPTKVTGGGGSGSLRMGCLQIMAADCMM